MQLRGFLSLSLRERGERTGYDLHLLPGGPDLPFLRLTGSEDWERVGPFFAVPLTLRKARSIISKSGPGELLIVDEVGPLELGGEGFWPALEEVFARPSGDVLLVVRSESLGRFLSRVKAFAPAVIDIKEPEASARLKQALAGTGSKL